MRKLALLAVLAALAAAVPQSAQGQLGGYNDPRNWHQAEVTWADMGALPRDSTFTGPLAAQYNLGYGATVLGLNLRSVSEDNRCYAVVASCVNDQLTVLGYLGPLAAPAQWDSGPYHLAAGLDDGRLAVWLTAPREYPHQCLVAYDYRGGSAFDCAVYPPATIDNRWETWTITAAYTSNRIDLGVTVATFDGAGRFREGPELYQTGSVPRLLQLRELDLGEFITPYLLYANSKGLTSAWHDPWQGWHYERLATNRLDNLRLWLSPPVVPPIALALYVDDGAADSNAQLQKLEINTADGSFITTRWGDSTVLGEDYGLPPTTFIDSVALSWPLVAQASDGNIFLAYYRPDPAGREILPFSSVLLHYGARRTSGGNEVAAYPITDIAGTAHWHSGDPEIYWIQLGGFGLGNQGLLQRLAYRPPVPPR